MKVSLVRRKDGTVVAVVGGIVVGHVTARHGIVSFTPIDGSGRVLCVGVGELRRYLIAMYVW